MQHSSSLLCLTAALFVCCVGQDESGWHSTGRDPVSLSPNNNSMSYVEPLFCESDDACKLDLKKGVELNAKWTVKVPQGGKIVFSSQVGVFLDMDHVYFEDASVKVEDYETGVAITDTTFEEYTKVIITTNGTLQADDVENGMEGEVLLTLKGIAIKNSEWDIMRKIEIAEDSE